MATNTLNSAVVDEQVPATIMVEQRASDSVANLAPIAQGISLKADGGCIRGGDSASDSLEKWLLLDTVEWKSNSTNLFDHGLPGAAIKKNLKSPAAMMFKNHKYWNGDMHIKIQINSSKFMIGRLLVSFYYGKTWDACFGDCRGNIYNRTQNMNALVSAASNNIAEFTIPYAYCKPFLATRASTIGETPLEIGVLNCHVLNPLQATSNVAKSCYVSVWIRFTNNNFSGLISSSIKEIKAKDVEHQVLDGVVKAVNVFDKVVNGENSGNRDLPPNPLSGQSMIPRTSSNMSTGKNDIPSIATLRLDAVGSTPSVGSPASTLVHDVVRNWGLLAVSKLKPEDNVASKLVVAYPVAPLADKSALAKIKTKQENKLQLYGVTPLGCISSLFMMWKGSIEFRFDFVASQFHTGRFMIAFVPDDNDFSLNIDDAKCSYNVIFDLEEDNSVVFTAPYIADSPWWPVRGSDVTNSLYQYTGIIYLYVINPLVVMDNIPKEIAINIYCRAGPDFELAVPTGPILGVGWDQQYLSVPGDSIKFAEGYSNVYVGTWRNYYGGIKVILRYGAVSDHVAQLVNANYNTIYKIDSAHLSSLKFEASVPTSKSGQKQNFTTREAYMNYIVVPYIPDDTPRYAVPFFTYADAHLFVVSGNDWGYNYTKSSMQCDLSSATFAPTVAAYHQIRELNPGCSTVNNMSKFCFGESFNDLKDLLRRYQLYMHDSILIAPNMDTGLICFKFPVLPSGLPIRTHKGSDLVGTFNAYRQGHIPLILSAYRFFRGSIRLKLVFVCSLDIVALVQFKPNVFISSNKVFIPDRTKALSHYSLTDSSFIQASSVNKVVDIEVPFYMNTHLGLLQRPLLDDDPSKYKDIYRYFSLGDISVSFLNTFPTNSKVELNVFYAVGDDFEPYLYQGFPAMTHIQDVPVFDRQEAKPSVISIKPSELKPLHFSVPSFDATTEILSSDVYHQTKIEHQILTAVPLAYHAIRDSANKTINLAKNINTACKVASKVRAVHQSLNTDMSKTISEFIDSHFGHLTESFKQTAFNSLSQLIHCFINPKRSTIAWALASFFVSIGFITYDSITAVISFFEKLCGFAEVEKESSTDEKINLDGTSNQAHHQTLGADSFSEKEKVAFISVCISGIATSLGMVVNYPRKNRCFISYLNWFLKGFATFTLTTKVVLEILSKTVGIFMKIFDWLCGVKEPDYYWQKELKLHASEMEEWAMKVNSFVDPLNYPKIEKSPLLQKEVFDLAGVGNLYIAKAINATTTDPVIQIVKTLSSQINKVQSRLIEKHLVPAAKFEPFVFQLFGGSNIGKSTIQYSVGADMLKKIGYTGYGEYIYTRTPGNKYLNTLSDQKIFVMDDFLQVRGSEVEQENLTELFCLKSRGIYNPPMAELENKGLRYSPLIVMLSSNEAFWKLTNISDHKALYRRRDTLWYAYPLPEYRDKSIKEVPKEIRDVFGHLRFVKVDPLDDGFDPKALIPLMGMTYEQFKEKLIQEWYEYYVMEMENYQKFLHKLTELYPEEANLSVEDLKNIQKETVENFVKNYVGRDDMDALSFVKQNIQESQPFQATHQTSDVDLSDIDQDKAYFPSKVLVDQRQWSTDFVKLKDFSDFQKKVIKEKYNVFSPCFLYWIQCLQIKSVYFVNPGTLEHTCLEAARLAILDASRKDNQIKAAFLDYNLEIRDFLKLLAKYNSTVPEKFKYLADVKTGNEYLVEGCNCTMLQNDYVFDKDNLRCHILGADSNSVPITCKSGKCVRKDSWITDLMILTIFSDIISITLNIPNSEPNSFPLDDDLIKKLPLGLVNVYKYSLDIKIDSATYDELMSPKNKSMAVKIKEVFSKVVKFTRIEDFFAWCKEKYKSFAKWETVRNIFYFLALAGAIKTLYNLISSLFSAASPGSPQGGANTGDFATVIPESAYNTNSTGPGKPRTSHSFRTDYNFNAYKAGEHQSLNENKLKAVVGAVSSNLFILTARCGSQVQTGRGLGLYGTTAIILKHHLEGISRFVETGQEVIITITWRRAESRIEYSQCDFRTDPSSSLCFVKLPRSLPLFKSIIKYMPTIREMESIPSQGLIFDTDGKSITQTEVNYTRQDNLAISPSEYASGQTLDITFRYHFGRQGLCGAPLICGGSNPRIVGIHVAGNGSSTGYAQPVYREFVDASGYIQESQFATADHHCYSEHTPSFLPEANVIVRGSVDPSRCIHYPRKSRIIPSPLHDLFAPETTPAPLCGTDPRLEVGRDLLREGIQKRNRIPFPGDVATGIFAVKTVNELLLSHIKPLVANTVSNSVLSVEEALLGIEGISEYNGVDFRTSEGYPWILSRPAGAVNKSWLFSIDTSKSYPKLAGVHPSLLERLRVRSEQYNAGIVPETIFTDSLKDARIDPSKIPNPAPTRIFSMSPVDFTVSVKQLFGHFQASLISGRIHSGIAVGINPDGPDWGELYRYLAGAGDQCFEGDYKAFGDTLDPECILSAIDIINNWYRLWFKEDAGSYPQRARRIIGKEISNGLYLARDCVYQTLAGLPSGCPITVEINSIVGLIYIASAYFNLLPKHLRSSRCFYQFVKSITYGDDFLVAVHPSIRMYFNGELFKSYMAARNIIVTNSTKTGTAIELLPFSRCTFLKRSFAQHPTRPLERLAPIRPSVYREAVLWQWNTALDPTFQSVATCRSALELVYSRGIQAHDEFSKILYRAWCVRGLHFHYLTWHEIDDRIYDFKRNTIAKCFEADETPPNLRCKFYSGEWAPILK